MYRWLDPKPLAVLAIRQRAEALIETIAFHRRHPEFLERSTVAEDVACASPERHGAISMSAVRAEATRRGLGSTESGSEGLPPADRTDPGMPLEGTSL
jgi:hypothetical protein